MDNKDLQIIDLFLRDFAPEIAGRSVEGISADLKKKLILLSQGNLSPEERRKISQTLLSDQDALAFLLAQVQGEENDADSE